MPLPDFLQVPLEPGGTIVLPRIEFAFGSAHLSQHADSTLNSLLHLLMLEPELRLAIEGHCDSVGDPSFNDRLSLERAQAIQYWLVRKGIQEHRLESVGFGNRRPAIQGSDQGARGRNRRCELRVLEAQ